MSIRQIGPEHMSRKDPDCFSGEFRLRRINAIADLRRAGSPVPDSCPLSTGQLQEMARVAARPELESAPVSRESTDEAGQS